MAHNQEVPNLKALESLADSQPSTQQHTVSGRGDPVCNVKLLLAEHLLGTVKWFNNKNDYGLISHNDTTGKMFVHHRAITSESHKRWTRRLVQEETVQFYVVISEKGTEVSNVIKQDGHRLPRPPYATDSRHTRERLFDSSVEYPPSVNIVYGTDPDAISLIAVTRHTIHQCCRSQNFSEPFHPLKQLQLIFKQDTRILRVPGMPATRTGNLAMAIERRRNSSDVRR